MLSFIRATTKIGTKELQSKLHAHGFDVEQRTIQRDLQSLACLGLQHDNSKPMGWRWRNKASSFVLPALTPADALMLVMARDHLQPLLPPALLDTLKTYFLKAEEVLQGSAREHWRKCVMVLAEGPARLPVQVPSTVTEVVYSALLEGVQFEADYAALGKPVAHHQVHPLGLVSRGGVMYVVATFDDQKTPLQLALHRISHPRHTERPARPPQGFSLNDYVKQQAFDWPVGQTAKLHLRLLDGIAPLFVERPLSDGQILEQHGDDADLHATVQDTMQLRWWLLSYGTNVEVLGPAKMRRWMREQVLELAKRYRPRCARR